MSLDLCQRDRSRREISSRGQGRDGVGSCTLSLAASWSWNPHVQGPSCNHPTPKLEARGPQTAESGLPPAFANRFIEIQPHSFMYVFFHDSFHAATAELSSCIRDPTTHRGLYRKSLLTPALGDRRAQDKNNLGPCDVFSHP